MVCCAPGEHEHETRANDVAASRALNGELDRLVQVQSSGGAGVFGEQHHRVAHATHQVADLHARTQCQQRELARAIVQGPMNARTGDDVHGARAGIDRDEDRCARVVQTSVHGYRGVASLGEFANEYSELVAADVSSHLDDSFDVRSLAGRQILTGHGREGSVRTAWRTSRPRNRTR